MGVILDPSFLSIAEENQKLVITGVECEPSGEEGKNWKPSWAH